MAATATASAPASTKPEVVSAPAAPAPNLVPPAALAAEVEAGAPAHGRLAIAYTPEVIEAQTAAIPAGDFVVCWVGEEKRLILKPGLNSDIDFELWKKAKEYASVQELLGQRAIEEIDLGGPTVNDTPAFGVTVIKTCDQPTALRLVHVSRDVKQLEGWLALEERSAVRNNIASKLKQLKDGKS